ncbi:MAG TPA: cytochrome c oxidase subunit 3 [Beijerinckiaceae bacterium]|nr:cytochrome c oxidase subunit 3 [Beijerinckiaceae bacterium]
MSQADGRAAGDPFAGLPGHPMMWILIGSELLVFGAALIAFSAARLQDPAGFAEAQNHLDRLTGLINVLVLVTSGLFAALAVGAARIGNIPRTRLHLALASLLGLVFLGFKGVEYSSDLAAGFTIDSGTFFTLYYLITGFHALHVVLGLVIFAVVFAWPSHFNVETGAAFWHMVDLVWLLVFPVIYLVR